MIPDAVKLDILTLLNVVERAHACGYTVSRPRLAALSRLRDYLAERPVVASKPQVAKKRPPVRTAVYP